MPSFGKKLFACGILACFGLACSSQPQIPASPLPEAEDPGSFTIFSNGQGPPVLSTPEPKVDQPPAPARPKRGMDMRYPPPISPPAPLAPQPPPIPPRYSLEPPPSQVKMYPDFKVEKLGLWPCDHYTAQYLSCINRRVPRDQDSALAKALAKKVAKWKALVETEGGREQAAKECEAALVRTKRAMQPYQCVWN